LELTALEKVNIAHHSSRGMLCGLYWVLGYEFRDMARIIEELFATATTDEISKPAETPMPEETKVAEQGPDTTE
jgi:hypothetical protein